LTHKGSDECKKFTFCTALFSYVYQADSYIF
jgi:hypothetical protein